MFNAKHLLSLFIICISVVGCTTPMQKYWLNNQFSDSAKYFEDNLSLENSELEDLYYYCIDLYEIKNYQNFIKCHDTLLKRSENVKVIGRTSINAKIAEMHAFKAQNLIDLGANLDDVQEEVDLSMELLNNAPSNFHNGYKIPQIHVYQTAGALAAIKGEKAVALDYIEKIKNVTSAAEFQLRPIKNAAVSSIYFILKDYDNAKRVIEEYSGSEFYSFAQAMIVLTGVGLVTHYIDLGPETDLNAWEGRGFLLSGFMLSKILFEMGEYGEAKIGYEELLSKGITQNYGRLYWVILADLGTIYENEGQLEDSIEFLKKAVELIEKQRKTIFVESSKIGFVGDKQQVYQNLIASLFELERFSEAFEYAERGKARALVDLLASKKSFSDGSGGREEAASLLQELDKAEKKSIAIAYTGSPEQINNVRALKVQKKQAITQASSHFASLITVNPPGVKEIQSLLPLNETIVEYYYHGNDMFAFVVTQNSVYGRKLDGKGINNEISVFRQLLLNSLSEVRGIKKVNDQAETAASSVAQLKKAESHLYKKLFQPLEGMISTENLTIVPHGALHYLPFNALFAGDEYFIDKYNMRVLPSAGIMKFLNVNREGQGGEMIIFGNPDLGDVKYNLPFAQEEALTLKKIQSNSKVLLRKEASETAVKKFANQFKYVHFACHGEFNPDKPLESGLLLSKDGQNDGMLTVSELYEMSLNADLVTLSACETALGKVANGDDVVGFTRGFLYAGTNAIVSSLWQVDDLATSILMQEFYKNLKYKDKRTALRLGQLKVKNTYNSHPFFWAAFQLTGALQ